MAHITISTHYLSPEYPKVLGRPYIVQALRSTYKMVLFFSLGINLLGRRQSWWTAHRTIKSVKRYSTINLPKKMKKELRCAIFNRYDAWDASLQSLPNEPSHKTRTSHSEKSAKVQSFRRWELERLLPGNRLRRRRSSLLKSSRRSSGRIQWQTQGSDLIS
jgi:hypothetical protein